MAASLSANSLPHPDPQDHLSQVWVQHQDDPQQQALLSTTYCLTYAPHLAGWLKERIYASLPDRVLKDLLAGDPTDGRLVALCLLAEATAVSSPAKRGRPGGGFLPYSAPRPSAPERLQAIADCLPDIAQLPTPKPSANPLRADIELGRGCTVLDKAAEFRLYVLARELTRRANGSGKVTKHALKTALKDYDISYTPRHFNRLLRAGEGLFWRVHARHLYLVAPSKLALRLLELDPTLFDTNRPGGREMVLPIGGSLAQWEAIIYAGWMGYREQTTFSRACLERLFGRDQDTLRRWEQERLKGILRIRANYVQCVDVKGDFFDYVPPHAQPYLAEVRFQGKTVRVERYIWRTVNTYFVSGLRQHPHQGQGRKVRKAVNGVLGQPANEKRGGALPSRRYFDSERHLKRHLRQYGGVGYLWRGENRHGHGLLEINNDGFGQTWPNERVSREVEALYFAQIAAEQQAWLWAQGYSS